MNILNVGYGTTNPQTLIHLVQSNVALRLEDPRDNINSIINIDFKRGTGLFGESSNNDWRLSSSNSIFNVIKYSGLINLTNCVNVTNCINLTHVNLNYSTNPIDLLKLPDFSKCIKLQSFKCNSIYLNLELFPDIIEYKGLRCEFNYVSYIREKIKTEERLNKLEEDNRELRKIIDELRRPSKYM